MDVPSLRRLFSACDVNKSGQIEYEDFTVVCRELRVPENQIRALFRKFDPDPDPDRHRDGDGDGDRDRDGAIDYANFSSKFQEVSETLDLSAFGSAESSAPGQALRTPLAGLYQAIMDSTHSSLLPQYEEVITALIKETLGHKLETDLLENNLKRTEDMNNSQLDELEEDIQKQLAAVEQRVRDQERKKMEDTVASMQRRHEIEENERLQSAMLAAQTDVSVLHLELDKLKNMYTDQELQHHREMNKKLYDSNDGLRSALASEAVATKRRMSPKDEIPARRMKPLRQSTLNQSSWADKYLLDSGVALPGDSVEMSGGSDLESTDSRDSMETVHHSYSYVPSDMEPDVLEDEGPAPIYRLVLAGDAGAGKSSFLLRLALNEFRGDMQTTLGVDFQMKKLLANGVLLLYDVTSESSFLNVRAWVEQIQESTEGQIPMCIIGNKVDLREERPEGCVSTAHGEKLASAYGALFCETSAKEGTNVVEAVLHLAREVKKTVIIRDSASEVRLGSNSPKRTLNDCC
ncbi:hypothetical protein CRUP_006153 [Coryphaenoides rupestris]|nr:hypothetical protein CRUP_006153 [Coryphaenoides rupestris]